MLVEKQMWPIHRDKVAGCRTTVITDYLGNEGERDIAGFFHYLLAVRVFFIVTISRF